MLWLVLFWLNNSFVDSALWFHATYRTPIWVSGHLDIIWLALGNVVLPFLVVISLRPKINTVLAFIAAILFGGVLWDLNYSLLTRGSLVSDSLNRWFALDDFGFVVGIPQNSAWLFHGTRIVLGIIFLVILIFKTNKKVR